MKSVASVATMTDPIITIAISPHCSWQGPKGEGERKQAILAARRANDRADEFCMEYPPRRLNIINLGEGI